MIKIKQLIQLPWSELDLLFRHNLKKNNQYLVMIKYYSIYNLENAFDLYVRWKKEIKRRQSI